MLTLAPRPSPTEEHAAGAPEWEPPATFDEYRLVRALGRGASSVVYLAHDTLLDRPVSVKFLRTADEAWLSRFLVEARAAARIQHPNVATLFRVGQLDQRPYLVSEYIRGQVLDRIEKPVAPETVLSFAIDLARGLGAAHRRGVLHRDIKPGNAIVTEAGDVKLLDFGLAKLVDAKPPLAADRAALRDPGQDPSEPARGVAPEGGAGPLPVLPSLQFTEAETVVPASRVDHLRSDTPEQRTAQAEALSDHDSGSEVGDTFVTPDLTSRGAILGTPYYMAPEAWRGEEATPRTDLYSLGALLYELCEGAAPHREVRPQELPIAAQTRDPRPLREAAPDVPPRLGAIIDRCLRRDPSQRFASADELLAALEEAVHAASNAAQPPPGNPYRGLQPFDAEHRAVFFGRRRELTQVLERLRTDAFVVLTGDSGVGKSSLCLAGVLPATLEGGLGDGRTWRACRFVPGRSPVASLCAAVAQALKLDSAHLEATLRESPAAFARELVAQLGIHSGLVLYVDQLEELVTLSSPESAAALGEALAPLCAGIAGIKLLATSRSDFLTRLAAVPGLGDHLPRALLLLRGLSADEMREAIVGPARAAGVRFESEALVDALVRPAVATPGALPLLQFALAELWEARDGGTQTITAATLEAIGGVDGALARHAEGILLSQVPAEREAARQLLVRLVTAEGTRARRTEEELAGGEPLRRRALDALVRGRLLVAREEEGRTTYEIAHEALLRGSTTLAGWLGEAAESRALRERLGLAAREWERLRRAPDLLWTSSLLREAKSLPRAELSAHEQAFLTASERMLRQRRTRRVAGAATLAIALVIAVAGLRVRANRELTATLAEADEALAAARNQDAQLIAARRSAIEQFLQGDRAGGDRRWSAARELEAAVERAFLRADAAHERALYLGNAEGAVRERLADLLFERAAWADREGRHGMRDLFLQRMRVHDDGTREAAFRAAVPVELSSSPPGATVEVERYEEQPDGRWRLLPTESAATAPSTLQLPPGSYVLTFKAPSRVAVRYPLLIQRGVPAQVSVTLPRPSQIPSGFVYVPGGAFLYGSRDEDAVREFFNAVPLHEVRTGPYLIARTETTYAEYLKYLDSLPRAERRRRAPKVSSTGLHGFVELAQQRSRGWVLRLQPAKRILSAGVGEKIRYPSRGKLAEHDWLRMPVSGISFADAQAYVKWLRTSGTVPGARLCSELEWERAARGADDRIYPHGNRLAPDDANFDLTYGKDPAAFGPDEVGARPWSRSPFELEDMAGNVWEWVTSALPNGGPVARGGSYYFASSSCRVNNREQPEPSLRDLTVGLRVCASL